MATELIAGALADRRDELVAAAVDAYLERLPSYRQAGPDVLREARLHTEEHHDLLCGVLRRDRLPTARTLAFVERHAARRARQGIALADFLEAFRRYHNIVWDAVLDASRQSRTAAEQALAATRTVIGYVDLATTLASAQTMKTSAATSDAHQAATDHDTPSASAMTAAAQPQAAPAITCLAASPGRPIRALGAPGSRARFTTRP